MPPLAVSAGVLEVLACQPGLLIRLDDVLSAIRAEGVESAVFATFLATLHNRLLDAIKTLHTTRSTLHGDLSPANVLLDYKGHVQLCHPRYLAPDESLAPTCFNIMPSAIAEVGAADMFALGCLLHTAAAQGVAPYHGSTEAQLRAAYSIPPPALDPSLVPLCVRGAVLYFLAHPVSAHQQLLAGTLPRMQASEAGALDRAYPLVRSGPGSAPLGKLAGAGRPGSAPPLSPPAVVHASAQGRGRGRVGEGEHNKRSPRDFITADEIAADLASAGVHMGSLAAGGGGGSPGSALSLSPPVLPTVPPSRAQGAQGAQGGRAPIQRSPAGPVVRQAVAFTADGDLSMDDLLEGGPMQGGSAGSVLLHPAPAPTPTPFSPQPVPTPQRAGREGRAAVLSPGAGDGEKRPPVRHVPVDGQELQAQGVSSAAAARRRRMAAADEEAAQVEGVLAQAREEAYRERKALEEKKRAAETKGSGGVVSPAPRPAARAASAPHHGRDRGRGRGGKGGAGGLARTPPRAGEGGDEEGEEEEEEEGRGAGVLTSPYRPATAAMPVSPAVHVPSAAAMPPALTARERLLKARAEREAARQEELLAAARREVYAERQALQAKVRPHTTQQASVDIFGGAAAAAATGGAGGPSTGTGKAGGIARTPPRGELYPGEEEAGFPSASSPSPHHAHGQAPGHGQAPLSPRSMRAARLAAQEAAELEALKAARLAAFHERQQLNSKFAGGRAR